jgi:hypothetical protein
LPKFCAEMVSGARDCFGVTGDLNSM